MKTKPNRVPAELNLAVEHHRAGRLNEARVLYQKFPRTPDAIHLLGVVARQTGHAEEAVRLIKHAIALNAKVAVYHQNLGVAYCDLHQYEQSIQCYQKALSLNLRSEELFRNLGNAYLQIGKREAAWDAFLQAQKIDPNAQHTLLSMATLLCSSGKLDDAARYALDVVKRWPEMTEAYNCLGMVLQGQKRLSDSITMFEHGLSLNPQESKIEVNLASTFLLMRKMTDARVHLKKALGLNPKADHLFSSLLFTAHFLPEYTKDQLFLEHQQFSEHYELPLSGLIRAHKNSICTKRKLRIGYVSPEFRTHAMQYFIESVIKAHNRTAFEIYCYYYWNVDDEVTERFKLLADCWVTCAKMSDEQLAERIRQDQIDILIDLSGHTGEPRLLVFARKPAPVQVTWMGYPNTTGLKAMDYRITDELMDPVGVSEKYHTETLVRLPYSAGYTPPTEAPEVNQLPALTAPGVTFACLNNPAKINLPLVGLWAQILNALPGSRLILGSVEFSETRALLLSYFAHYGIDESRLQLLAPMSMRDYLAFHHQIDLALDPFPYCGGTSTNHSLWMGVPVLTRTGDTSVSRIGAVLMHRVGLPEFITQTPEDYVSRAIEIASDLPALNGIRQGLRERMSMQAAMDPNVFIGHVEDAFRKMWQRWCDTQLSQSK